MTLFTKLYFYIFFILFPFLSVKSQPVEKNKYPFRSPVDLDIRLSGNFAELRGSHFHAGIDIKTNGTIGHNIYSIADGYVSRIKVSPYGYGNALYIRHPNGYTSVYGHLSRFNIQIGQYVSNKQYNLKKFAVDLYPQPDEIPVNMGDVIALSGNSGGSTGPHLHFEIRKSATEKPQNPLFWDFEIADNIAPRFHHLILNPLSDHAQINGSHSRAIFKLDKEKSNYYTKDKSIITVSDTIGVVAHVNDYLNNTHNKCGVYELKMYVDDNLHYHLKMDDLSFAENRYILIHADYQLELDENIKAHKCYVDEGNHFSGYEFIENQGLLFVAPGQKKNVKIIATDVDGNKSDLQFTLLGVPVKAAKIIKDYVKILYPGKENVFETDSIKLKFSEKSLFRKVYFQFNMSSGNGKLYSDVYSVHNNREPVNKRYFISIKTQDIPFKYQDKVYLAGVNGSDLYSVASNVSYKDKWLSAHIRSFGNFAAAIDTVRPEIIPINIYEKKYMLGEKRISFIIKDNETGIDSYNGYINGEWVLFQYDAKNDLVYYEFDDYLPKADKYVLKLIVSDNKKNTAVKTISFDMP
jgi:hypothetical protein